MTKTSLIAAIGTNRALGKNNDLIYKIPEDLKRFKQLTLGHPIIMGRKTFESIGRPLPNRANIVISRDLNFSVEGVITVNSLENALKKAREIETKEIFIIGGGQIFEQAIHVANKLYLTVVEDNPDADVYFPNYADFKKIIFEEEHQFNDLKYKFLDLESKP